MTDRAEFNQLVREALANLYDYAALETHPLTDVLPLPRDQQQSRGEYLRHLMMLAIKKLRPLDREPMTDSREWRPYLVLHGRYVEGVSLQELQDRFSLSERQLRREHSRAVLAIATCLWNQLFPDCAVSDDDEIGTPVWPDDSPSTFEITLESLNFAEVVRGVTETFQLRVQSEGAELHLCLPQELPHVRADRVILRQILLSLLSYALYFQSGKTMTVLAKSETSRVILWIQFEADGAPVEADEDDERSSFVSARFWTQRLGATLQEIRPLDRKSGLVQLTLSLPCAAQPIMLVVDDQVTALRLFQRYLSRYNIQVVGVQEPKRVLPLVCQLQPQVVTLDVMMPVVDGWEILQTLQTNPETQHIPVIVCSVWDEPELASLLGAAAFLKKPVTQQALLDALAQLNLVDIEAG